MQLPKGEACMRVESPGFMRPNAPSVLCVHGCMHVCASNASGASVLAGDVQQEQLSARFHQLRRLPPPGACKDGSDAGVKPSPFPAVETLLGASLAVDMLDRDTL